VTQTERERQDDFLRLYVEHEEALRGFVRSLVPTLEDAREVMQEVAAVLWRKFEALESTDDFRRWAFGVARFEAFNFNRARQRERLVFDDELLNLLAHEAEAEGVNQEREAQALEHCLQKLPETQRALVQAAYAPGVRMDELARDSGRSAMSLYKSLHRIRIALIQCTRLVLTKEAQA
jgi:RNA polymerase sigma-70 factor (ECF subfamily)